MRLCILILTMALCACTTPTPFMLDGSDTVPNKASCHFRGAGFCHPATFNI